ncbi:MAG: hypothetical protein K6L76_01700 [Agarilytica sp.]
MKNETSSSLFQQQQKETVTNVLEDYAIKLEAEVTKAMEQSTTGFLDKKELHEPIDFSEVANDIWKALDEIDNSPVAQIMHGVAYGISETAVQITEAVYQVMAERIGETLTTSVNDLESYIELIEPLAKQVQQDLNENKFHSELQHVVDTPSPSPSDKDYLNSYVMADNEPSQESTTPTNELER